MANQNDIEFGEAATEIINDFGVTTTFAVEVRSADADFVVTKSINTLTVTTSPLTQSSRDLWEDAARLSSAGQIYMKGDDWRVLQSLASPDPIGSDVTLGGTKYTIIAVKPLWSGEQVAATVLLLGSA